MKGRLVDISMVQECIHLERHEQQGASADTRELHDLAARGFLIVCEDQARQVGNESYECLIDVSKPWCVARLRRPPAARRVRWLR